MRLPLWSCLVLCLGAVPVVTGAEAARTVEESRPADRWIEQLGSADYQARESASKALLALGTEALPALRRAISHADPEVRRRIEELIPVVEAADVLAPKRVSLRLTERPLREAIAEVSKQTGYKLTVWPEARANGDREKLVYNFDFDGLPFWQALDRLCSAGGLVVQQANYGDDSLRLQFEETYVPFVYLSGPFRVVAQRFDYGRNISFGSLPRNMLQPVPQGSEHLNFTLSVAVEPKLPLLRVGPVRLTAAYDDQKQSMLPDTSAADRAGISGPRFYYGGGYRTFCQQAQVSLAAPSKSARTVKLLRGTLPVTLLTKQEPALVTDRLLEAKGKKLEAKDATFEIEEVTQTPAKQHQIKLAIHDNAKKDPNDYSRIHSLYQRLEVQDAQGTKYQVFFNSIGTSGPSTARVTFTCDSSANPKLGPPARLVYHSWVTMDHEVPFEFKDLPLP